MLDRNPVFKTTVYPSLIGPGKVYQNEEFTAFIAEHSMLVGEMRCHETFPDADLRQIALAYHCSSVDSYLMHDQVIGNVAILFIECFIKNDI